MKLLELFDSDMLPFPDLALRAYRSNGSMIGMRSGAAVHSIAAGRRRRVNLAFRV